MSDAPPCPFRYRQARWLRQSNPAVFDKVMRDEKAVPEKKTAATRPATPYHRGRGKPVYIARAIPPTQRYEINKNRDVIERQGRLGQQKHRRVEHQCTDEEEGRAASGQCLHPDTDNSDRSPINRTSTKQAAPNRGRSLLGENTLAFAFVSEQFQKGREQGDPRHPPPGFSAASPFVR